MARRTEAGEQAGEEQELSGTGGAGTRTLVTGGLMALAAGGLLATASLLTPKLGWIATRFAEMGITSGVVIAGGVLFLALAMITRSLARVHHQAREFGAAARDIRGLYHDLGRIEDRASRLQMEMSALQEANKVLLKAAQDQSALQSAGHQIDATYRLAASLDQLGVRVEERLNAQQSDLEKAMGLIRGSVSETRQQLESWLEHYEARPLEDSLVDSLDGSFEDSLEELEYFEQLEQFDFDLDLDEEPVMLEGPEALGGELDWDLEGIAELPEFDDEEELEVLVTLEELDPEGDFNDEDEIVLDLEEEYLRGASALEEAPPVEEPEEAAAEASSAASAAEPPTELERGLGLLDTLDDHGTPRGAGSELGDEAPRTRSTAATADRGPDPEATPEPPSIFASRKASEGDKQDEVSEGRRADPGNEDLAELLSDEALQEALDKLKHRHDL